MKKVLKKFCRGRVVAVLMTVLMVIGTIVPSLADTIRKDGLEVTITTDKEVYRAGEEIKVTVAVKNTGQENIENVMVELEVPEGIQLAEGSDATVIIGSIKAGEEKTEEVSATAKEDVNTGGDNTGGDNTGGDNTGDNNNNGGNNSGDNTGDNNQGTGGNTGTGDNGNGNNNGNGSTGTGDNGNNNGTGNGNASIDGTVVTGDINFMTYLAAAAIVSAVVFILIKRKNNKAAGIIGVLALTLIGCGLTIQVSYAAVVNGRFEVSKTVTVDGKEKEIKAIVTYGTKVADVDVTANYKRVSVHDPSIVKDPVTGTYYVFGSHMAWAKSDDLINWEIFTNNINRDYKTLFAEGAEWSKHGSTTYDVSGNLWAPDVIYNEDMGKWCMYMSVNGDHWYTSIALLTADSLDGDWEYKGTVVYSGFTNATEAAETDLAKVIGTNEVPARYLENRNGNHTYGMNAIDPCVKYDEDGNLWMTYGSWFGGIYMLRLDKATGLRDYTYPYETVANVSDEYQGLKLAGGAHVSGEASYIEKIGDYWYLFMSYGGLVANGGYNMRVFRSENITGPYTDVDGNDARFTAGGDNVNGKTGVKIFGNYKWNTMKVGNVAQGHNSLLVDDDGKAYVVYHTRFADGTEGHQVRVHQLFTNQDGWLVAAPYEYTGETLSTTGYAKEELAGSYEVLYHKQSVDYKNLECVTPQDIVLNNDGTVSGDYTGTWECEADSPYVTMVLGGVEYNGVFVKQYVDETTEQTMCFTLLGDNEVEFWGSKYLTGKIAVDMTLDRGIVTIPQQTVADIVYKTEGLYGTTISYASGNTAVLSNDGTVTRGSEDVTVKVTATFTNGDYSVDKEYNIKVLGDKGENEKLLVGSWFTDGEADLSKAAEGTYSYPNPFNKTVTNGLEIYNGATVEFDVEGNGAYLSTILSFFGGGRMYFTGGSYLGYNATGGFFDANVKNSDPWGAGTNFISGKTHFEIKIKSSGFEVYANGAKAYDSADLDAGRILGSKDPNWGGYANVLKWLNNTAETLNLGWGSWWNDKFNGKISNVKLWAEPIEKIDTSAYAYYQDFSRSDKSEWMSKDLPEGLKILNAGDKQGNYLAFETGTANSRGAVANFNLESAINGKYTISMDVKLKAGNDQETQFAITGKDFAYTNKIINDGIASGYILKLSSSKSTTWNISGTEGATVTIPDNAWVNIKAEVDTASRTAKVDILNGETSLYSGTVSIDGTGELSGIYIRGGRRYSVTCIDTIAVTVDEAGGDNPDDEEPPTVTANVSGTAYPDKDSNITVTFTGDKELSSKYPVKINGTAVTKGKTVDMMTVNSITYSGNECTVSLKMSAINGWHSVNGSYDVELMNGSTALASQNVSYSLDLSSDTDYTVIKPSTNNNVKAYYKFDGTKMYVMTVIKGTIHCDETEAGGTTYDWWNGACSQLYVIVDGAEYSVGSHVYQSKYANGIDWPLNNSHTVNFDLINNADTSKVTRSYMALGTFGDDTDTDTGCVLLNVVDFSLAGYTANTLSGKTISFCGFIGPNDNTLRFEAILESETYTIVNGADPIEDTQLPTPLYFFDFENAQLGGSANNTSIGSKGGSLDASDKANATIIGSGEIIEDSERGKVFHNAVGGQAIRTNYLLMPEDSLAHSVTTKGITISMWVNKGTATDFFFSPMFSAYAQKATENSWPMMILQSRLIAQVNCTGFSDFPKEQLVEGSKNTSDLTVGTQYLDDGKWHYYTATFDNEIVTVYVDGVIQNKWDASVKYQNDQGETVTPTVNGLYTNGADLKYVCLGGNQAWSWPDVDAAYKFDDVAIYNTALTQEQILSLYSSSN